MEGASKPLDETGAINKLGTRRKHVKNANSRPKPRTSVFRGNCYACGKSGHMRNNPSCPAKNEKCRKCHNVGHFEVMCKTKVTKIKHSKVGTVKNLNTKSDDDSDSDDYVFVINQSAKGVEDIIVNMGGIDVSVVIDSGASVNVIDRVLWEKLKAKNIKCKSRKTNKPIYSYGSQESLTVAGCFTVEVCVPSTGRNISTDVYVIEEPGCAILCRKTATLLGLLNLSVPNQPRVNALQSDSNNLSEQFNDVFTGVGKLKDYQLKITVDPSVQPIIQSTRLVPYRLREKAKEKYRGVFEITYQ